MYEQAIWRPAAEGNYGRGRASYVSQITFHHIVGDAPAAIARFQTPGELVSAHFVISSSGEIFQCVKEENASYADDNFASNQRSITIEHAGGHPNVPYTDAMYDAASQLVSYLIGKYGITSFKRHRDVSNRPTACPGALDVERIIEKAHHLNEEDEMSKADINLVRILAFHILGFDGQGVGERRKNAINKELDTELQKWVGQDVGQVLTAMYNDPRSNTYRNLEIPQVYNLARQVNGLQGKIAELEKSGKASPELVALGEAIKNLVKEQK